MSSITAPDYRSALQWRGCLDSEVMAATQTLPARVRMAFIPGLLTAAMLLVGLALIGGQWFFAVQLTVAILAAIMAGFAIRGHMFWWLIVLVPMVVVWNPVFPLSLDGLVWRILHIVGTAAVVVAGVFITVPLDEGDDPRANQRRGGRR